MGTERPAVHAGAHCCARRRPQFRHQVCSGTRCAPTCPDVCGKNPRGGFPKHPGYWGKYPGYLGKYPGYFVPRTWRRQRDTSAHIASAPCTGGAERERTVGAGVHNRPLGAHNLCQGIGAKKYSRKYSGAKKCSTWLYRFPLATTKRAVGPALGLPNLTVLFALNEQIRPN